MAGSQKLCYERVNFVQPLKPARAELLQIYSSNTLCLQDYKMQLNV